MNKNDVNILEEAWLCQSFLKLKHYKLRHKLFAGDWSKPITREMVARPQVAVVLPYDPILDRVVLIEQFRIGAMTDEHSPWLMEIVAGVAEEGESIEALAHRETAEESGLVALELLPIYRYWVSPGFCNERVELFCARVDASQANGIHGLAEEDEDIRVSNMPATEAFAAVASGKINNAATMMALQWLQLNHQWLREKWGGTV